MINKKPVLMVPNNTKFLIYAIKHNVKQKISKVILKKKEN